jgi:hypothetical protein
MLIVPDRSEEDLREEVRELSDEEESGIHAAIESVRAGKGVSLESERARLDRILGR